jgi:hypothetical protein
LEVTQVTDGGIVGDRVVHVSSPGGRMALDCGVVSGGRIAVGDPVEPMEDGEEA